MKMIRSKEQLMYGINILALILLISTITYSCNVSNSAPPVFAEQKIICDYLRTTYKNKPLVFELAVAKFDDFSITQFCKTEGFRVPKEGQEVKRPRRTPEIMRDMLEGRQVNLCKHFGYDTGLKEDEPICKCLNTEKHKRLCVRLAKKHDHEKL
jgi:hypothetical protein